MVTNKTTVLGLNSWVISISDILSINVGSTPHIMAIGSSLLYAIYNITERKNIYSCISIHDKIITISFLFVPYQNILLSHYSRESEWLFGTPAGRRQLQDSARFGRLVVAVLRRGHKFESLDAVKEELAHAAKMLIPYGLTGQVGTSLSPVHQTVFDRYWL